MTCREDWPHFRQLLVDSVAVNPPQILEESVITEMCLGNKFLQELRPAQQRVNIQTETQAAMEEADAIIRQRRIARANNAIVSGTPEKPAPPSARPPVVPEAEEESSEEVTPRMQTRAVVPETKANDAELVTPPVVVQEKQEKKSSFFLIFFAR
jgi:hypothetical protein